MGKVRFVGVINSTAEHVQLNGANRTRLLIRSIAVVAV
jgi:hypothetical protein